MKLAGLLTLGVTVGYCTFGCSSPTAPTNDHPKEIRIIQLTDCYDEDLDIKVSFFDEKKFLPESACASAGIGTHLAVMTTQGECVAAGLAYLPSRAVGYWRPWVQGSHDDGLRQVAAHEVSHVLLMSLDEAVVGIAATLILGNCM